MTTTSAADFLTRFRERMEYYAVRAVPSDYVTLELIEDCYAEMTPDEKRVFRGILHKHRLEVSSIIAESVKLVTTDSNEVRVGP